MRKSNFDRNWVDTTFKFSLLRKLSYNKFQGKMCKVLFFNCNHNFSAKSILVHLKDNLSQNIVLVQNTCSIGFFNSFRSYLEKMKLAGEQ